ncbi:hypothetical protein AK51_01480 [Serratia nematodiphila DZ0503SBS1]|nr:hypothetical protein AK51_01480 [Serratia nematodiphila DZ0503SBS1]
MLVALNELWRCGLDDDQLAALGLSLGADVPVFVRGHAAFAEGIGERLLPAEPPENGIWWRIPRRYPDTAYLRRPRIEKRHPGSLLK